MFNSKLIPWRTEQCKTAIRQSIDMFILHVANSYPIYYEAAKWEDLVEEFDFLNAHI